MHFESYRPGVDVVVVNYKTPDDLHGFLRAFIDVQFEVPCTLHIVDVDPDDTDAELSQFAEVIAELKVPYVYTGLRNNVGYAKACNSAAFLVSSFTEPPRSTIAFFNADTRLQSGVLDECHWQLHQNHDWAVVGPKQVNEGGFITHAGVLGTHEHPLTRGWKERDGRQYDDVRDDCVSVSGSAYFVKRAAWDALHDCDIYKLIAPDVEGAFLPTPHYYEETWLSYHAAAHGWKIAYLGNVQMIHRWHKASPVGGFADRKVPISRAMFRKACDTHGIPHN